MESSQEEEEPEMDATLVTLRNKIMKSSTNIIEQEKEAQLEDVRAIIRDIINKYHSKGALKSLYTENGAMSVQPVTRALSKGVLKLFSVKDLRKMMAEELNSVIYKARINAVEL